MFLWLSTLCFYRGQADPTPFFILVLLRFEIGFMGRFLCPENLSNLLLFVFWQVTNYTSRCLDLDFIHEVLKFGFYFKVLGFFDIIS